jgi:hypothetical protein
MGKNHSSNIKKVDNLNDQEVKELVNFAIGIFRGSYKVFYGGRKIIT